MSMWETILIAFAAASSAPVPGKEQPITIQWQTTGDLVEVKVVGLAQKAIQLTYILEVTGTSNTRTSGIANLAALSGGGASSDPVKTRAKLSSAAETKSAEA